MTDFLVRLFIKNSEETDKPQVRSAYGKLAGLVGILCNVFLFAGKLLAGLLTGSISIAADAVNNLSDASSSIVTLLGFRMAEKPADQEHPYGHARIEYLSGLAVAVMILVIGIELLKTSFQKVLHPTPVEFGWLSAGILLASIGVKLWMAGFNRKLGKKIGSATLEATAADSRNDVITTSAVLAAGVIGYFTNLMIDGWMGLAVAAFILYSGVNIVKDTINPLLGAAPDPELVSLIRGNILKYDGILGVHDLMVHDYGPGQRFASAHVEIDRNADVLDSHNLIDEIERHLSKRHNLQLVLHYDPLVTDDPEQNEMKKLVEQTVQTFDHRIQIHDFRLVRGARHTDLMFDVVVPFDCKEREAVLKQQIDQTVQAKNPKYYTVITFDDESFNFDPKHR